MKRCKITFEDQLLEDLFKAEAEEKFLKVAEIARSLAWGAKTEEKREYFFNKSSDYFEKVRLFHDAAWMAELGNSFLKARELYRKDGDNRKAEECFTGINSERDEEYLRQHRPDEDRGRKKGPSFLLY